MTKQIKQFEPVRVEVTVEQSSSTDTPENMLTTARLIVEHAIIEAIQRGPVI